MNKKNYIIITMFLISIFSNLNLFANEYNVEEIIDKTLLTTEVDGLEAVSTLIIRDNKGHQKERKLAQISKLYPEENVTKKLMKFITPADVKGTMFLTFDYADGKDNDQWLYLPSLRKIRKIVSSEKGNSFMGSEFTYADISRLKKSDFKFKFLSEKEIYGEICWEIEETLISEDKEDEYGFLRKIIYISKNDFVVRAAKVYDFDNKLFKELSVKEIKKIDLEKNRYAITHMIITNLENGRVSELIIENIMLNRNVKDDYFTFRYLNRN